MKILRYQPEHEAAVAAFNARGTAHDAPFSLSKTARVDWLPAGGAVWREYFLAVDGEAVRGGFTLRRQPYWLRGAVEAQANYQGPISEGLWDERHKLVGIQLLMAALREQPMLNAIGMGGLSQPLPRLLASARWALAEIPFRFRVLRAGRFLRQLRALRRTSARGWLMDFAAMSGLGPAAIHALHWWKGARQPESGTACEVVHDFGAWADEVWEAAREGIAFTAVRDRAAQNALFGDGNERNIVLRCTRAGRDIGWAVVRSTPMRGDRYFGDLRVGSLVDCLARPGEERAVVALATQHAASLGSDLVVTNQSHLAWLGALASAGWLAGPSNYLFAASPKLASSLGPLADSLGTIHFNRADGDGPIHL